jgi:hypothetical protein
MTHRLDRPTHHPLSYTGVAPSPTLGRNTSSESVATHDCTRDTVRGGAGTTGVPHPLMGRRIFSQHGQRRLSRNSSDNPPSCKPRRVPTRDAGALDTTVPSFERSPYLFGMV